MAMPRRSVRSIVAIALLLILLRPTDARAHPQVENALDVVISPAKVDVLARIARDEIFLVQTGFVPPFANPPDAQQVQAHGTYVLKHLHLKVDGRAIDGELVKVEGAPPDQDASTLSTYRIQYPLAATPALLRIDQDLLKEHDGWSASCAVRIRQNNQPTFQSALLTRDKSIEFGCDWAPGATTQPTVAAARTSAPFWTTARDYLWHGVRHIISWDAWDHLLFATALVLAVRRITDLIAVVTAFTLAHTITLTLSVLNIFSLPDRVVEPMIAASIVFVALQNVFWPERSRGWARLAVAFSFGLFHGLGFAGGLKEAMSGMPGSALGAALGGFSAGVELGHQVIVLPLFALLYALRHYRARTPRTLVADSLLRYGSGAISLAGMYFLVHAIRSFPPFN
jgi:hypothetical protein